MDDLATVTGVLPDAADVGAMPTEMLEAELCSWAANQTAAEAHFLALVAEFDDRRAWTSWGCASCAAWLAWHVGLDVRAAREKVRVARALTERTLLREAMVRGHLSYAKVRALTRIANEHNERDLVDIGLAATSNQVERFVSAYRRCQPDEDAAEEAAHASRGLWVRRHGATTEITLRVPSEAAACVLGAVDAALARDLGVPLAARRVDALVDLVEAGAASGASAGADRYLATIHLSPDAVAASGEAHDEPTLCAVAPGDGLDDDPVAVPVETARRVLCDAVLEGVVRADGSLDDGRRRRVVPPRLKRALRLRDVTCRFPGCGRSAWLDGHHVVHWLDGGHTNDRNVACLCRHHHRLVHEGRWGMRGDPDGELSFVRPDGRVVTEEPRAVDGAASAVVALGRTADDGRCRWLGDPLHADEVAADVQMNERITRESARTS